MKAKRRVILAAIVLLLANLSCGIFSKSPENTVKSFYKALDKGEVDEALGYLSMETTQTLGYDKWRAALIDASRQTSMEGEGIKQIEILESDVNGDIAWVRVEVRYENGTSEVTTLDLVKENDEWKIEINPWLK